MCAHRDMVFRPFPRRNNRYPDAAKISIAQPSAWRKLEHDAVLRFSYPGFISCRFSYPDQGGATSLFLPGASPFPTRRSGSDTDGDFPISPPLEETYRPLQLPVNQTAPLVPSKFCAQCDLFPGHSPRDGFSEQAFKDRYLPVHRGGCPVCPVSCRSVLADVSECDHVVFRNVARDFTIAMSG